MEHNIEVVAQRNRGSSHAFAPNVYSSYKIIRALCLLTHPVSVYCNGVLINSTKAQQKFAARSAEVELFVFSF